MQRTLNLLKEARELLSEYRFSESGLDNHEDVNELCDTIDKYLEELKEREKKEFGHISWEGQM